MTRAEFIALAMQVALALARRFEGFRAHPYLCAAGMPTIGFGATYYLDGRPVRLTDPPITRDQAEALLYETVRRVYLPAVLQLCPGANTPERLAALIDFAFNLGTGNLRQSNLRRAVNRQDWEAARIQVMRWVRAGGKVLAGLVKRREAERALM